MALIEDFPIVQIAIIGHNIGPRGLHSEINAVAAMAAVTAMECHELCGFGRIVVVVIIVVVVDWLDGLTAPGGKCVDSAVVGIGSTRSVALLHFAL